MQTIPRIIEATAKEGHRLFVRFNTGEAGEVDFDKILPRGYVGPFAALKDLDFFRQVKVADYGHYIFWSDEVDYDPIMLYCHATGKTPSEVEAVPPKKRVY